MITVVTRLRGYLGKRNDIWIDTASQEPFDGFADDPVREGLCPSFSNIFRDPGRKTAQLITLEKLDDAHHNWSCGKFHVLCVLPQYMKALANILRVILIPKHDRIGVILEQLVSFSKYLHVSVCLYHWDTNTISSFLLFLCCFEPGFLWLPGTYLVD